MSSQRVLEPFFIPNTIATEDSSGNVIYSITKTIEADGNGFLVRNLQNGTSLGVGSQVFQLNGSINIDPLNLTAISPNPTPQQLVICNDLIVQDDKTAPNNIINLQSGVIGVGTNFGIDYESTTNQDFTFQTINTNTGGVVFKQYGANATTTQTKITQGVLKCSNTANSNAITIDASAETIVLTDGTNTNTINQNGYSTKNTTQNLTHYLNFSDSSSSGIGAIQKTAGLSVNPSTNTITATTFVGALNGTATNATNVATTSTSTNATYYPTFVSATSGNNGINVDTTLTYNPSTDTLTCANLAGTATNATNAVIGLDNASTLVYPTFVKTSGAGNKGLFIDDTTTPLTYNPSTGALTTTSFVASGSSTTNTIGASSMVIANPGGTLTINQGSVSTTASILNMNAGTSLNLQVSSATIANVSSSLIRSYQPLYLNDNSSHDSIINANWFGTASVNSTNLYQPSSVSRELNIGALGSGGTITKYPFNTLREYASTTLKYTSATDTTPLSITGTDTSKTISVSGGVGSTNYSQSNSTYNSGNSSSGIYDTRNSGSSVAGVLPSYQLYSVFPTPTGEPYSVGNYLMKGSVVNMLTNYTPIGIENNYNIGFQTSNNGNVDMFVNPDSFSAQSPTILRVGENTLTYGIGVNGTYAQGDKNPAIATTYFSVNSSGITTPTTLQLPTGTTTLAFSGSVAINGQSKTFEYFNLRATGTTNTISGFSFVNMPQNAVYTIAILNSGSGNLTINAPTGIRTNYTTSFVVPTGRYATLIARYLFFGSASYYCLEATLLQTN